MGPENASFAKQVKRIKRIIIYSFLAVFIAAVVFALFLFFQNRGLSGQVSSVGAQLDAARGQISAYETQLQGLSAQLAQLEETGPQAAPVFEASFSYQQAYPDLYIERGQPAPAASKTIYLTFDDGPSGNTSALLDILDEYGVKATFFIVGAEVDDHPAVLRQIAERGHTIGIHTDTHNYRKIYESVDAFLADFAAASQKVEALTGQKPAIFRFPGGSINAYNQSIYQPLIAEMLRRGYVFFDWNVSAEDATSYSVSKGAIVNAILSGAAKYDRSVILLHDSDRHENTVLAVKDIIETLSAEGYTFAALDNTVPPVTFSYNKE
ncbi:MAG: polysaccharide deacetylase family protein [Oscillospiraceae bacterium]|nr:polysaccharide deacetylase family protein [Oscillospiraceae bacterium]